jgi:branched-chain amino acid transport system permease protein
LLIHAINILLSGMFHAAILFLVAAGLQLVFGVQRIFNLACGSFYALGAYTGVSAVNALIRLGLPHELFLLALLGAGVCLALIGPLIEWLLHFVYERDEALQLLLTFALVLMFEDVMRLIWGTAPLSTGSLYLIYGQITARGVTVPVYNLIVIAAGVVIALLMGAMLARTRFGRIIRATAENREMSAALGVNLRAIYVKVFTLGTMLGTLGGALVIPATATMSEMGIELIVEAFAVVVIGGLGSMRGALVGALVVGILQAVAISTYPELEMVVIYLIVIGILVLRPQGLFGEPAA